MIIQLNKPINIKFKIKTNMKYCTKKKKYTYQLPTVWSLVLLWCEHMQCNDLQAGDPCD